MGVEGDSDAPQPCAPASTRKRRRETESYTISHSHPGTTTGASLANPIDLTQDVPKPAKKIKLGDTAEERRLRWFRTKPPTSFEAVYQRALTQRFYVLTRTRCGTPECPEEVVELAGSTGNIYTVVISLRPACDCPHAQSGSQCKHVLYVLARVLRAPYECVYQLALLASELRGIFARAPNPGNDVAATGREEDRGNRKPVEGTCPICFEDMNPQDMESIVWCRAACGQNIHKCCFEMWAATKRKQGVDRPKVEVTCPYCRGVWQGDEEMVKKIKMTGRPNDEGYVNVADQLGINTVRDTSPYSTWWPGHNRRERASYHDAW